MSSLTFVGLLTPPFSGLAKANGCYVSELSGAGFSVEALDTGTTTGRMSKLRRLGRAFLAAFQALVSGTRGDPIVLGLEGNDGLFLYVPVALCARLRRKRIVYIHHSSLYVSSSSIAMRMLASVDQGALHVWPCPKLAKAFKDRYSDQLLVASVSLAFTASQGPSEGHCREPNRVRLAFIGLRSKSKGYLDALGAFENVALELGNAVTLIIAGKYPHVSYHERRATTSIRERFPHLVTDLGLLSPQDVLTVLGSVDFLLFPTRYEHETFGLIVSEALSAGANVIGYERWCLDMSRLGNAGMLLDSNSESSQYAELLLSKCRERLELGDCRPYELAAMEAAESELASSRLELRQLIAWLRRVP